AARHIYENRKLLVRKSSTCANDCMAIARHVPGDSQPRSKVVVITVVGRAGMIANLFQSDDWTEIAKQIIRFFQYSSQLVAHAQIDCDIRHDSPIILQEA